MQLSKWRPRQPRKQKLPFARFAGKGVEGRENWTEKTHKQETAILGKIFQIEYQIFESFEDNVAQK